MVDLKFLKPCCDSFSRLFVSKCSTMAFRSTLSNTLVTWFVKSDQRTILCGFTHSSIKDHKFRRNLKIFKNLEKMRKWTGSQLSSPKNRTCHRFRADMSPFCGISWNGQSYPQGQSYPEWRYMLFNSITSDPECKHDTLDMSSFLNLKSPVKCTAPSEPSKKNITEPTPGWTCFNTL